eukprot:scaffold120715_cov63-Phaeocystis_antarctica.AAC.2
MGVRNKAAAPMNRPTISLRAGCGRRIAAALREGSRPWLDLRQVWGHWLANALAAASTPSVPGVKRRTPKKFSRSRGGCVMEERRPASASMQPPAAARGRMRPESAGRSRPQSAGVNPDRLPLPPRMEAPVERVEYNGSSERVEYTGSSMAGPADVLRQSRGRPMSARSNRESVCSELSSANSVAALPRASKGLREARDEVQWLDTKFRRSGHSHPGEGEMTVVIEYCYNSSTRQISTSHNEQRYHEEAELVRQYVLHYCPEACVFVVPIDFKTATSFHRGGEARLGAFEIDARIRVDGEMLTCSSTGAPGSSGRCALSGGEAVSPGAQTLPRVLELAASKAADFTGFDHPGRAAAAAAGLRALAPPVRRTRRRHGRRPDRHQVRDGRERERAQLSRREHTERRHHRDASRAAGAADARHVHGLRHGERHRRRGGQAVLPAPRGQARAGARARTDGRRTGRAQGASVRAAAAGHQDRPQGPGRRRPRRQARKCDGQGDRPAHRPGDLSWHGGRAWRQGRVRHRRHEDAGTHAGRGAHGQGAQGPCAPGRRAAAAPAAAALRSAHAQARGQGARRTAAAAAAKLCARLAAALPRPACLGVPIPRPSPPSPARSRPRRALGRLGRQRWP